ncbi:hypothetical protein VTI74DRAFT_620 [Chaetomium olivicolor]
MVGTCRASRKAYSSASPLCDLPGRVPDVVRHGARHGQQSEENIEKVVKVREGFLDDDNAVVAEMNKILAEIKDVIPTMDILHENLLKASYENGELVAEVSKARYEIVQTRTNVQKTLYKLARMMEVSDKAKED